MRRHALTLLTCWAIAAGCSKDNTVTPVVPTLTIVSGNLQIAPASATLPLPLVIKVTGPDGAPLAGRSVSWVPVGGAVTTPGESFTGSDGLASTTVKLGASGGSITVHARVSGGDEVVFSLTSTGPEPLINLVATIPVPAAGVFQHDTYIRDGIAFLCAWNSGVLIYDVGNGIKGGTPSAPVRISSIITNTDGVSGGGSYDHNAWWFHNPVTGEAKYLFVGQEGPGTIGTSSSGDIHVVDVSNIQAPVEVGMLSIPGAGTHNFWMDESRQILYAAYYNAGVIAVDVSGTLSGNIANRIIANITPGGPGNTYVWGVHLQGSTLYVSDMLTGVWALDPTTLAIRGGGNNVPERYTSDLWVTPTAAYSGTWNFRIGAQGNVLKIWNLVGGNPVLADSLLVDPLITTVSDVGATPDSKALVVTGEGGGAGGLYLYDLTDPLNPALISSVAVTAGLHTGKISVIGGRTYVFASKDPGPDDTPALMIYDITGALSSTLK